MEDLDKKKLQEGPSDPASTYRMLRQLEEDGMVTSKWDTKASGPARRSYRITNKGHELLEAWIMTIGERKSRLERLLGLYSGIKTSPKKIRHVKR